MPLNSQQSTQYEGVSRTHWLHACKPSTSAFLILNYQAISNHVGSLPPEEGRLAAVVHNDDPLVVLLFKHIGGHNPTPAVIRINNFGTGGIAVVLSRINPEVNGVNLESPRPDRFEDGTPTLDDRFVPANDVASRMNDLYSVKTLSMHAMENDGNQGNCSSTQHTRLRCDHFQTVHGASDARVKSSDRLPIDCWRRQDKRSLHAIGAPRDLCCRES